jgi:hypothetical protein
MSNERLPDVNLQFLYHKYVNKIEREENVRVGFGLFLGGFALAALALLIVVASFLAFEPQSSSFFQWVQGGYALAMLSLPFVLLGIVVLLPPPKRLFLGVGAAGLAVALFATIGFLWAYPDAWNVSGNNYTVQIVLLYAVGVGAISVGTGTSLREHAPELVQTVTEIVQHDSTVESDDSEESTEEDSLQKQSDISLGDEDETDESEAEPEEDSLQKASNISLGDEDDDEPDEAGLVTLVINGSSYSFDDGDTFGRRDEAWLEDLKMACDGHEEIPYISGDHVEFLVEDDTVYVSDLSRNGTRLNGKELDGERAELSTGDTLVLADRAKLKVQLGQDAPSAPF